jgi:hypothetical protein
LVPGKVSAIELYTKRLSIRQEPLRIAGRDVAEAAAKGCHPSGNKMPARRLWGACGHIIRKGVELAFCRRATWRCGTLTG